MIVLAIAAVILLGVLLVVPALNRAGRNSARERDVGTMVSTLANYRGSFNALPSTRDEILRPLGTDGFEIDGKITGELGYYNENRNWLLFVHQGARVSAFGGGGNALGHTASTISHTGSTNYLLDTRGDGSAGTVIDDLHEGMMVFVGSECNQNAIDGDDPIRAFLGVGSTNGAYAIVYKLEGDTTMLCRDNV